MKRLFIGLSTLCALAVLSGCGGSSSDTPQASTGSVSTSLESLRSAPTKVSVGATSLTLNATLYRDDQPTITTSGTTATKPLVGSFTVNAVGGSAASTGLTVTSAYVVQNSTVGTFTNISPSVSNTVNAVSTLSVPATSTNYAPGSTVEVAVQVTAADGTTYLLQDPSVTISAAL